MRIPPQTPAGEYRLMLSLRSPGGHLLPVDDTRPGAGAGADAVEIQRIVVQPRPKQLAAGQPQVTMRAKLGDKFELRGYSLNPQSPVPGGKIDLTLYWAPLADSAVSYTVFTHLLDNASGIWAQKDAQPCSGGCPTTSWAPGDLIEDHYELAVKPDAAPGEYQIELGMYDPITGKRLIVMDGDGGAKDHVLLPKVRVGRE